MAIKVRKQITGTEAQIKGYAGHNGVLAYATDTKHLHVLSGTAGTTTKLANMSDIPAPVDISGKADKTYVDTELAKKQAKGDYATNTALTQGIAGKANTSHTHTKSQITDFPEIPDTSTLVPKTGDRGHLNGYELISNTPDPDAPGGYNSISKSSPDTMILTTGQTQVIVDKGEEGTAWTKVVAINHDTPSSEPVPNTEITLASGWTWAGGKAPEINRGLLVLHWNSLAGIASFISLG